MRGVTGVGYKKSDRKKEAFSVPKTASAGKKKLLLQFNARTT
jgi:hypothetical protein